MCLGCACTAFAMPIVSATDLVIYGFITGNGMPLAEKVELLLYLVRQCPSVYTGISTDSNLYFLHRLASTW